MTTPNDQAALWNSPATQSWVESQDLLDRAYKPFEDRLVQAAKSASRVLDVGCGTGGTTVAVARTLPSNGFCVGVDISAVMIPAARARAAREGVQVTFIQADAEDYPFESASFDAIISRFGVMFFNDPVAAFRNLRRAASRGAKLHVIAWRGPEENRFMTAAERAAAPLLPDLPVRNSDEPGQFGFASRERVAKILEESGWSAVDINPIDATCSFPATELLHYVTRMGPLGRILPDMQEPLRTQVIEAAHTALTPYVQGSDVRFAAACWMISATA